ncbi:hypothetical protein [Campylobacter lanienae]|nr:hypothetical protein [Campylobacter lanienae]
MKFGFLWVVFLLLGGVFRVGWRIFVVFLGAVVEFRYYGGIWR